MPSACLGTTPSLSLLLMAMRNGPGMVSTSVTTSPGTTLSSSAPCASKSSRTVSWRPGTATPALSRESGRAKAHVPGSLDGASSGGPCSDAADASGDMGAAPLMGSALDMGGDTTTTDEDAPEDARGAPITLEAATDPGAVIFANPRLLKLLAVPVDGARSRRLRVK